MAFGAASTATLAEALAYPPYTLANTQLRTLPRASNGRDYMLYVALPESYAKEASRRYPVLYLCDGYWSFPHVYSDYGSLVGDKAVPECIIVGLGYAGENLDYGRMRLHELLPVNNGSSEDAGHAAEFLGVLEKEIIPYAEREYRANPSHRVLCGGSYGGVFTLYAMFTKPELFWGYVALSPVVNVGRWPVTSPGRGPDGWMFGYEDVFAKSGRPLNARLFMSVGSLEWPEQLETIRRFDKLLVERKYPGLSYEFRMVEGGRHVGTIAEILGLQFVFAPLAPETGPMKVYVIKRSAPATRPSNNVP